MANRLLLYHARRSPRYGSVPAASSTGGTLSTNNYAFLVVAHYASGETSPLTQGVRENQYGVDGTGIVSQYAGYDAILVTSPNIVAVNWLAATRNGAADPELHHYSIYYQTQTLVGDPYLLVGRVGIKCSTTAWPDGNIPAGALAANVDGAIVTPSATYAVITKFDPDLDAFWIDGDHRAALGGNAGVAAAQITITGTTSNNGTYGISWCDLRWSRRGVQTVVGIGSAVTLETPATTKLLAYFTHKLVASQAAVTGLSRGFGQAGGFGEGVVLNNVVHTQPGAAETVYEGYDGDLGDVDRSGSNLVTSLQFVVDHSCCTALEWNWLWQAWKSGAYLWIVDENDEYGSGLDVYGYGALAMWYGKLTAISYLGNSGKNNSASFMLSFKLDAEGQQ